MILCKGSNTLLLSEVMGKSQVWDSLPTFKMWPGKTFFGLDKSSSHCFTLPKSTYPKIISFFVLNKDKLQHSINLVIGNRKYPAMIRLSRQDRSKPIKLRKEDLPERDVIQIQWKNNDMTEFAIRVALQKGFEAIKSGNKNEIQSAIFVHIRENDFAILPSNNEELFSKPLEQPNETREINKTPKIKKFVEDETNLRKDKVYEEYFGDIDWEQ